MDFAFAKEHDMVKKSVREFFTKACPKDRVRELKDDARGYDPGMWKKMAQLGYQGLVIPEQYGGLEGDFLELMIFMEETGRNIVPSPFFSTVVQCGLALRDFGTAAQQEAFLPGIAEQGDIWSWAHTESGATETAAEIQLTAVEEGDDYILNGTKLFVPFANSATFYLVSARTQPDSAGDTGLSLFVVDAGSAGLELTPIPTTAHDKRFEVRFNQTRVPAANILGEKNGGWTVIQSIMQSSAILKAAEMSGGAQAALQLTVNYTRERKQFDKPLGSFQAIQHRLADLLTQVEGLKYQVYRAAWLLSQGTPSDYLISAAKAKANAVYHNVCHHGVIMHGAIGWTEEMDIGLYHIRTRALTFDGGGSGLHRQKMAEVLRNRQPDFMTLYES
ncbi:acyl-CoA/acyl-ACP dehydrogenase [bacterium]|nr:acyl-CoA/acyl-ACP dehydrogenase [bacterium]